MCVFIIILQYTFQTYSENKDRKFQKSLFKRIQWKQEAKLQLLNGAFWPIENGNGAVVRYSRSVSLDEHVKWENWNFYNHLATSLNFFRFSRNFSFLYENEIKI